MPARHPIPEKFTVRLDTELRRKLSDFMAEDNIPSVAAAVRIAINVGLGRVQTLEDDLREACIEEGMRTGLATFQKRMQTAVSQALGDLKRRE